MYRAITRLNLIEADIFDFITVCTPKQNLRCGSGAFCFGCRLSYTISTIFNRSTQPHMLDHRKPTLRKNYDAG